MAQSFVKTCTRIFAITEVKQYLRDDCFSFSRKKKDSALWYAGGLRCIARTNACTQTRIYQKCSRSRLHREFKIYSMNQRDHCATCMCCFC